MFAEILQSVFCTVLSCFYLPSLEQSLTLTTVYCLPSLARFQQNHFLEEILDLIELNQVLKYALLFRGTAMRFI